jgi:hypothetical protein
MSILLSHKLPMYSEVFLIISSDDVPEYAAIKDVARSHFDIFPDNLTYAFVESCAEVGFPEKREREATR